ncbi:MAG: UDP-N-acetylglucosamine 2-epimerase (non-hydrolyzing) [candidate division KSB1 bacterium]|jgi:UDP-N-acetylglucosamine 2-epimerase (non-hydrolysing)|nr:UDP-N-acetylglucosamine 2-epimerase (non-hydrolyzing) [candidate division KSB1 bacterium]
MKVVLVAGARPNFMKVAPILRRLRAYPEHFAPVFVHTGQHYDADMSDVFLADLGLPEPDYYLGVGSGTHAEQTAAVLKAFEPVVLAERPDLVIVVGDVNSTLAAALAGAKLCVPVAHVEAGLRSFDRTMPEELNRILTDHLCELLFTTCEDGNGNLRAEGIGDDKIHFVGNTMVESLLTFLPQAEGSAIGEKLHVGRGDYCLVTLHRPSNVDDRDSLRGLFRALQEIAKELKVIFPAHPRTQKRLRQFGLWSPAEGPGSLVVLDPLGYVDFLCLEANARLVITDSGGVQEETSILGVPCLTVRQNTERPITITMGTNVLVGTDPERLVAEAKRVLAGDGKRGGVPPLWDEHVSERIVAVLIAWGAGGDTDRQATRMPGAAREA